MPRKSRAERQESLQLALKFEEDKNSISEAASTMPPAGWKQDKWRLHKQIIDLHRKLAAVQAENARLRGGMGAAAQ